MTGPASGRAGEANVAVLIDVNEQLLLTALRTQSDLDATSRALTDATNAAQFDILTALPNRVLLFDRIRNAIAHATRENSRFALLFLDLNGFKQINDTFGHRHGDDALRAVARTLVGAVRAVDTVCRYGGDEFVILLPQTATVADAELVADKIRAALSLPQAVGDQWMPFECSVGTAMFPDDGASLDALVHHADAAMYLAKPGCLARAAAVVPSARIDSEHVPSAAPAARIAEAAGEATLEVLNARLREANGQLVLAALGAQDLRCVAEEALRRQAEFLAMVAHEMRGPLSPIRNAAALLGHAQSRDMLPTVKGIIERQTLYLSRLIEDLLECSRARAGHFELQRSVIELGDVVAAAIDTCRPVIGERQQSLDVNISATPLPIDGDPVRLGQVLVNLLGNASKYTPKGGTVGLRLQRDGRRVTLVVWDTGIGITPAALAQVFEPFVQEPHAAGHDPSGLGIGLTVARELVEAHGGTIVASSAGLGCGSRFDVTLPLVTAMSVAAGASPGFGSSASP